MNKVIFSAICGCFLSLVSNAQGFLNNGSNLYYDKGNVGIGTSAPVSRLMVDGGSATFRELPPNKGDKGMTTLNFLNYGIAGNMHKWCFYFSSYGGGYGVASNSFEIWEYPDVSNSSAQTAQRRLVIETGRSNSSYFPVVVGPKGSLNVGYESGFRATDKNDLSVKGNVGIGVLDTQGYKLAVNGTIRAKEVKVESGWADFVFAEDYKLPTLKEVKQHIAEKGTLPGVPSADEVKVNGVNLAETNALLLQKIEELTLYVIKQQEMIEELQNKFGQ